MTKPRKKNLDGFISTATLRHPLAAVLDFEMYGPCPSSGADWQSLKAGKFNIDKCNIDKCNIDKFSILNCSVGTGKTHNKHLLTSKPSLMTKNAVITEEGNATDLCKNHPHCVREVLYI